MNSRERIKVYSKNPRYWQYKGKPILLVGGSKEDNLFQIPDLEEHLDLLKSVGGNYVRNTMSSRDEGNVWAFKSINNSKYNLDEWSIEYWKRFENLLKLTYDRNIIVQIEVWATFDFTGAQYGHFRDWSDNPFNPRNNTNYSAEESKLKEEILSKPRDMENNFFKSVPRLMNIEKVLYYQKRFVDKMLSYSLNYPNVLYCIDNETHTNPEWGWYWAKYIKQKAMNKGVDVEITEMYWEVDFTKREKIASVLDHSEIYSFVEASQNNFQKGQKHWDNGQIIKSSLTPLRPMNNNKMYGSSENDYDWTGTDDDAIERFWRNIFGGMASCRFHRPVCGMGLNKKVQSNLKSIKMFIKEINIFECEPNNDIMLDREDNHAYAISNSDKEYSVFFTNGGSVKIRFEVLEGQVNVKWLDILNNKWVMKKQYITNGILTLTVPTEEYWVAIIK